MARITTARGNAHCRWPDGIQECRWIDWLDNHGLLPDLSTDREMPDWITRKRPRPDDPVRDTVAWFGWQSDLAENFPDDSDLTLGTDEYQRRVLAKHWWWTSRMERISQLHVDANYTGDAE